MSVYCLFIFFIRVILVLYILYFVLYIYIYFFFFFFFKQEASSNLFSCECVNSVYGIKDKKISDMEKKYAFDSVIVPRNHALLLWDVL